jgi:hypothetical protein
LGPVSHPELPRLAPGNNEDTSGRTQRYNCIAWAAGDDTRKWWPTSAGGYYWPPQAPRSTSLAAFQRTFETLGFEVCEDEAVEPGFDKVAFYEREGEVTHAARQLDDGSWTSKLGDWVDISHATPDLVGGGKYGEAVGFMRRDQSLPRPPGKPLGRNDPCWCKSGRKYKQSHGR